MNYIASISDSYPYKHYGEFISKNDYDYLIFVMGEKIHNLQIDYKIIYNVTDMDLLYKWDILAVNRTFYLVNEKVKMVLSTLNIKHVEYIPAKAYTRDGLNINGYYILNILDDKDIYRDENTQVIYSERLVKAFKEYKLKGLTFYPIELS